jgi:hypothetical protein
MSKERLFVTYLSPVRNAGTKEIIRHDERKLFPVLKVGFESASGHACVCAGNEVVRIEGGFFGKHVHYTVTGVEIEQSTPDGPRFPILLATDDKGETVRLKWGNAPMIVIGGEPLTGSIHDGWCSG